MRASSRLLLVGLLALWAELAPISGQVTPPVRSSDQCQLPPKKGPCKGQIKRYYYNPSQKKCLQFIYGGCQGNSNNFETQKACEETCGKISPATRSSCQIVPPGDEMPGDFCSTDDSCPGDERCCKTKQGQQCALPVGVYRGHCPKNPTKLGQATICLADCSTDEDCNRGGLHRPLKKCCSFGCRRSCAEAQEDHPGVCLKRKVVQTFVPCNNTCKDDGDCPLTQKCCFTGCSRGCLDPVRSDRCQLPPETGPCRGQGRASFERYYYNPSQKKCLHFIYGGCQGNSNNFETQEACEEACGKISPEVCKLPSDSGPCLGFSEMYYFNSTTKTCETFTYGLCRGNGNRFSTKLECLLVCGNAAKSPAQ